jgi:hypothetical protein
MDRLALRKGALVGFLVVDMACANRAASAGIARPPAADRP